MAMIQVNYGVNRAVAKHGRVHIEHRNGKLILDGDWEDDEFRRRIRLLILKVNPGWNVTGYANAGVCPKEDQKHA